MIVRWGFFANSTGVFSSSYGHFPGFRVLHVLVWGILTKNSQNLWRQTQIRQSSARLSRDAHQSNNLCLAPFVVNSSIGQYRQMLKKKKKKKPSPLNIAKKAHKARRRAVLSMWIAAPSKSCTRCIVWATLCPVTSQPV